MKHVQQEENMETVVTCKNCGTEFRGNYCHHCGQKADIHRLDAKEIIHDLFHAVTHVEKGFLHTFKQMFIRPGHSVREYLQGKRIEHANPFLMLLIIGALGAYLFSKFNVSTLNSINIHDLHDSLHALTSKFFAVLALVYSFVFALSDYFFFRYKKYYYAELFVFNIFQMVVCLLMNMLLLPMWVALGTSPAGDYARIVVYLLIIAYLIFTRYQFFEVAGDARGRRRLLAEILVFLIVVLIVGWKTINHIL